MGPGAEVQILLDALRGRVVPGVLTTPSACTYYSFGLSSDMQARLRRLLMGAALHMAVRGGAAGNAAPSTTPGNERLSPRPTSDESRLTPEGESGEGACVHGSA